MEDGELLWWQKNAIIFGVSAIGSFAGIITKDALMVVVFFVVCVIVIMVSIIQYFLIYKNEREEEDGQDL